jgi:hypothetical protein
MDSMASRLTPLGILLKWIVVPASLGAIGYFLVGPRVDSQVPKEIKDRMLEVSRNTEPQTTASNDKPEEVDKPLHNFAEPEVDVSVTALNSKPKKQKRKRRRRKPPTATTTPSAPIPDAPSGGGSADPPPVGAGA